MPANPTVGLVQEPAESQFKSIGRTAREVFFQLGPTGHTTSGSASNIAVAGYDESIWQSATIQAYPPAVSPVESPINVGYDPIRAMAKLASDYEQRNLISQYHPANFPVVGPSVEQRLATPAASHAIGAESLEHGLELDWLEANLQKVYTYQGKWLAIGRNGIAAIAETMHEAARQAQVGGLPNPLLFQVPSLDESRGDVVV